MKKIFILSLVALSTLTANAQRKKARANTSQGNWAVRLGAGYNSTNEDPTDATSTKGYSLNIMPSVGYFVADNLEIGANINLRNSSTDEVFSTIANKETVTNGYGFGVYGQKYFPVNNWFAFTANVNIGLGAGNKKVTDIINTTVTSTNEGDNNFGGAATLGLAFTPANRIAIQADLLSLGAVSGTRQKEGNNPDVNYSNFGLNAYRQPSTVHIIWYFGNGYTDND
jgi:hypothetical protein